jgi:hypothetical protein
VSVTGQEFRLVVDRPLTPAGSRSEGAARAPRVLETVRVPNEVSFLHPGAPAKSLVSSADAAGGLVLEPLADGKQPRLLLLAGPGSTPPMVNGRGAPRVCLLRVGDQLLLDDGRLLHVTAFHSPRVGPATAQQVGKKCPICLTAVKRAVRVFTCCVCESVLHCEDPARKAGDEPLECATLARECPNCLQPISVAGGYAYVPRYV